MWPLILCRTLRFSAKPNDLGRDDSKHGIWHLTSAIIDAEYGEARQETVYFWKVSEGYPAQSHGLHDSSGSVKNSDINYSDFQNLWFSEQHPAWNAVDVWLIWTPTVLGSPPRIGSNSGKHPVDILKNHEKPWFPAPFDHQTRLEHPPFIKKKTPAISLGSMIFPANLPAMFEGSMGCDRMRAVCSMSCLAWWMVDDGVCWMWKGFSKNWTPPQNMAVLGSLRPGAHRLTVKRQFWAVMINRGIIGVPNFGARAGSVKNRNEQMWYNWRRIQCKTILNRKHTKHCLRHLKT